MRLQVHRDCNILWGIMGFVMTFAAVANPVQASSIHYDGYFGGLKVADVKLTLDTQPRSYDSTMDIVARGVIGWFYTWRGQISAQGTVASDGSLQPTGFIRQWNDPSKSGVVSIDFDPSSKQALGTEDGKPDDKVSAADRHDVIDPLSGLVAMQQQVLAGAKGPVALKVYDGKRRLDVTATIEPPRMIKVRDKEWRAIAMTATIDPVAGFKDRQRAGWKNSTLYVLFTDDGRALPIQIRIDSPAGAAILNVECGIEGACPPPIQQAETAR